MKEHTIARPGIARRASLVGVAGAALVSVLVACGSDPKKEPTAATATAAADPAPPPATSAPATAASAAPDMGTPDKQSDCDALVDDANSTLDAKRIEAADKACKKDSDCVGIKGRACAFNCVNGSIPKAEEKAWDESVAKVKDGSCKKWSDNNCAKASTKPAPACQDRKITCDKGRCTLK